MGVKEVRHRSKSSPVYLSSLTVSLVQCILLFHIKESSFTGLSEQFRFIGSGINKVDMSVTRKDISKRSSLLLQCQQ